MLSKKLLDKLKIKVENNKKLKNILDIVTRKMISQQVGCFVPGLGVSFINYSNQTRDSIGHLLGYSDLKGFWGLISSEAQSCLVRKIINKYNININYSCEYDRLLTFLQSLQDAHDEAFDEFNNLVKENSERMSNFLENCVRIEKRFRL